MFSFFIFFLVLTSAFSFGKKDKSESDATTSSQTNEAKKEFLSIDFLLDTQKQNSKNHFKWKNSSAKYNDYFDSVSGASKFHSTKNLREFSFDKSTRFFQIPKGLYCLCLFSVANSDSLLNDDFKISQTDKKITIEFTHRKNQYKIESDENGMMLVPENFSIIEFQKEEPSNSDENQNQSEKTPPTFVQDRAEKTLSQIYKGELQAKFQNGIFTLKGKLKLSENIIEEDQTAPTTDEIPNEQDMEENLEKNEHNNERF